MTESKPANAFIGKVEPPSEVELAAALGGAKAAWDKLARELAEEQGVTGSEWKSYSPKHGWALRVKRKERTIVWLAPAEGCFHVLFIFGEKAMKVVREESWPKRMAEAIEQAVKYPEGTGVRLVVKSARDVGMLKRLAAIKLAS